MNPFIQQLFNAARNTAERAFTGYGAQTLRNMGPQVRRATGDGILNRYAHPIVSAAKKDPSRLTAAVKGTLAAPGAKPALVYIGGAAGVSAANKTGLTGAIEGGLNQVGPGLDRFFGAVTPKPVQDFGRSMEQYGWGALGGFVPGERTAASVSTPERAKGTQAILNGKPVYWTGSKYGWQSGPSAAKAGLLGSEVVVDDVFAPVIGTTLTPPAAPIPPSTQRGAADRSYQQELSRTAQLTAQNPELQRYEKDRTGAKTQEERNAVRDMGLAMWQKEYGQKQIGKPGGAIGTFNPLMSTGNTTQTTGNQLVVPINTDEAPYQVGDFSRATLDSGYDLNALGITPETIVELQNRLLLQSIK